MLINSFTVLKNIENFRQVALIGRYGSHKTALAFRLAYELWQQKRIDRIVSNCESIWADDVNALDIEDKYSINTCVILDEGGLFLDNRRDVANVMAFLRKMNVILLVPSVQEPTSRMRFFTIQLQYSFKPLGVPLLIYRAMLHSRTVRDVTYFSWWRPDVYGVYNTLDAPVDGDEIMKWMNACKDRIASGQRAYSASRAAGRPVLPALPDIAMSTSQMIDSDIAQFEDLADRMEEIFDGSSEQFKVTKRKGLFG